MQRGWAHKIRNLLNKLRKPDQAAIKAGLQRIRRASLKAVARLRADLDDLLTRSRYPTRDERKAVRTTKAIERPFGEVRRRTRPLGTFQDETSMDRIRFALFMHANRNQGLATPFPLTPTS